MIGVEKFPCFAISVKNVKPNEKVLFNDAALSYPVSLSDIGIKIKICCMVKTVH